MKKILTLMLCLGLISGCGHKEPAQDNSDKDLEEIEKIEAINSEVSFNGEKYKKVPNEEIKVEETESGSATERLIQIQKEIEKITKEKKQIESKLIIAQNELKAYDDAISQNDIIQGNNLDLFLRYAKNFYMAESNSSLPLSVLTTGQIDDFIINYNMQQEFVSRLKKKTEKIAKDNEELVKNKEELENKTNMYLLSLGELESKNEELVTKRNELASLFKERGLDLLNEEMSLSEKIAYRIKNSSYRYSGNHNGFMIAPTYGTITSTWGDRVHPIYGDTRHHAGVDIGVDYNTPLVAAADGRVIMSSWYGGYGKTIMIDHGNNIVSLYGHNSSLLVKEGDYVKGGQPIALAGSTGNSTGPHCHFEVRENGTDIDPYTYIK